MPKIDIRGFAILDVCRVALGIQAQMTEDVHVPPALLHDLTIGIVRSLRPLKATDELPKAAAMLSELPVQSCDGRPLVQGYVGEQQPLPPVPLGSRRLPPLPMPPPSIDRNHLRFWRTLLHKNRIVEGYDNKRSNSSRTSRSLRNDLIMWRGLIAGHVQQWGRRWS